MMFFSEQVLGDVDIAMTSAAISRCIIGKILEQSGKLPDDYEFFNGRFFSESYYRMVFTDESIIETVDEAMDLLGIGSVTLNYTDSGMEIDFTIPGFTGSLADLFETEEMDYHWMAEEFLDENNEHFNALSSKDQFTVKLSQLEIFPHVLLKNIMNLIPGGNTNETNSDV